MQNNNNGQPPKQGILKKFIWIFCLYNGLTKKIECHYKMFAESTFSMMLFCRIYDRIHQIENTLIELFPIFNHI